MASKDDISETSQALFCALADYAGSSRVEDYLDQKKFKTYAEFRINWDQNFAKGGNSVEDVFKERVKSGKASFQEVEDWLNSPNDWYTSSVLIATKLVKEVNELEKLHSKIKNIGWSTLFYEHKSVVMDSIEKLFNEANSKQSSNTDTDTKKTFIPFGDINKWCPADIYFASKKAETAITKMVTGTNFSKTTFYTLNETISNLIDSGDLLPLSLKKQTSSVTIKKVNFDKDSDWKEIEKINGGDYEWKPYPKTAVPKNPPARDLKIFLTNTNSEKDKILFRHDASTATFKGEIILKGMEARGGSLGLAQILGIINLIDPTISTKLKNAFTQGNTAFKTNKKPIRKRYEDEIKRAGLDIKSKDKKVKEKIKKIRDMLNYDDDVGRLSAIHVTNKIMPIFIDDILTNEETKSSFVRMVYAYAASQSGEAAKFVIAK